jgi:hypothetical protein
LSTGWRRIGDPLAPDRDAAGADVDVVPAQPADLTAAGTGHAGQAVQGEEFVVGHEGEEAAFGSSPLPGLDPVGVIVHVNIPPDRSFKSVACSLDQTADEMCVVFAENVQDLLVEGELWGHAWPPCPVHGGRHPLWPELAGHDAVWMCTNPPTFAASVGPSAQRDNGTLAPPRR